MRLSIVIPVYNEHETLDLAVERIRAAPFEKEIIIVDDGSTDGSNKFLKKYFPDIKIIKFPSNLRSFVKEAINRKTNHDQLHP